MRLILIMTVLVTWMAGLMSAYADEPPAKIYEVREPLCDKSQKRCGKYDAIVFVHGIYGSEETFFNEDTLFNWPKEFPRKIANRDIDVYLLMYETEMRNWARTADPSFPEVSDAVLAVMRPLLDLKYRSIGFIAHSLGGNVVSTYLHRVKSSIGHIAFSKHGFVITLATPVLGAQIADFGTSFLRLFGVRDKLLESLERENLFLKMLIKFRNDVQKKAESRGCRAVNLHAAYEEKYVIGSFRVVGPESAALSVEDFVNSPVKGFNRDHSEIAKPRGRNDAVYKWVDERIQDEYKRLANWETEHPWSDEGQKLCKKREDG